ncbi:MAG: hypothetical protein KDB03_00385 [Planctomycetales bacterium]|nr:hypothetical protein [Planctomycetales bacterium]
MYGIGSARSVSILIALFSLGSTQSLFAQHDHSDETAKVSVPKIYLDKSPKIVEYQLQRLSNDQLLAIERTSEDLKYVPVYSAILMREGMPRAERGAALDALVKLKKTSPVHELVEALKTLPGSSKGNEGRRASLAESLYLQSKTALTEHQELLQDLTKHSDDQLSAIGYAALFVAGQADALWQSSESATQINRLLSGLQMVPQAAIRTAQHAQVLAQVDSPVTEKSRQIAIQTLAHVPAGFEATFRTLAPLIDIPQLRADVIHTLLKVPPEHLPPKSSSTLAYKLVEYAENTPAAERTNETFLDTAQLVDSLLAKLPSSKSQPLRERLRATTVRVIRVRTVHEEMRYDLPYFAVEAGRPAQVVLINEDLMPHNLVITVPGALQEVAELGMQVGPNGGLDGKQYVPHSEKVLFATNMVPSEQQEMLTFVAPNEPGEYPYVCTFPRHWMRMYGVMVVVENLDAWLQDPQIPTDPVGSNRSFVKNWSVEDFPVEELAASMRGRSPSIGSRLFQEASCAQCHQAGAWRDGTVGPNLDELLVRQKGSWPAVVREILDPSHTIDPKYAVHIILTVENQTITGLIIGEDKEQVLVLDNPESRQPIHIPRDDIEIMRRTTISMMPKGLLDRYSRDEIYELLGFLESIQKGLAETSR